MVFSKINQIPVNPTQDFSRLLTILNHNIAQNELYPQKLSDFVFDFVSDFVYDFVLEEFYNTLQWIN